MELSPNISVGDLVILGNNGKIKKLINGRWLWRSTIDTILSSPSIVTDKCNNVYISGSSSSKITYFNSNDSVFSSKDPSEKDSITISKLSSDGNWIWNSSIMSNSDVYDPQISYSNGYIYVSGIGSNNAFPSFYNSDGLIGINGISGQNDQIFVGKLMETGFWEWCATIDSSSPEKKSFIETDNCGNAYVCGSTPNGIPTYHDLEGNPDLLGLNMENQIFLGKISSDGHWIWNATIENCDIVLGMSYDGCGNVYVMGLSLGDTTFYNSDGVEALDLPSGIGTQVIIGKITSEGQWVWCARIDSPEDDSVDNSFGSCITADSNGNIYVVGCCGDIPTYYNANGQNVISKSYPLSGDKGLKKIFVGKLSNDGRWIWNACIDSVGQDVFASTIETDKYNNVYVGGYGSNNTNPIFYNSNGSVGSRGIIGSADQTFIGKITSYGKWIWNSTIDSLGQESSISVASDNRGNLYSIGSSENVPTFYNTDSNTQFNGHTVEGQTFIAKITNEPTTSHFITIIENIDEESINPESDIKFSGFIGSDKLNFIVGDNYYIETTSHNPKLTNVEYNGTWENNRFAGTAIKSNVIAWNVLEPDSSTKGKYDVVESSSAISILNETIQELVKRTMDLEKGLKTI